MPSEAPSLILYHYWSENDYESTVEWGPKKSPETGNGTSDAPVFFTTPK